MGLGSFVLRENEKQETRMVVSQPVCVAIMAVARIAAVERRTCCPILVHRGCEKGGDMTPGLETIVDAQDCSADALRNMAVLRGLCERLVGDLELQVVGQPQWHAFPDPGGVTGLYLLSESHLACHTYPEFGLATFNLYCCRDRANWDWRRWLELDLGAQNVSVRVVARGEHVTTRCQAGNGSAHSVLAEQDALVSPRGARR
jgi:S-adenosylmethionine decarboxylase